MAYCVPLGIPHSILLGRAHPNPDDPSEPYWLPDDVATALSFRLYEALRCRRCGTHPDDWPEEERDDPNTWEAYETRCRGCMMIGRVTRERPRGADMTGVDVRLRPYDDDRALEEALAEEERARSRTPVPQPRPDDRGFLEPDAR